MARSVLRFGLLTFAMICAVGALALAEGFVLWKAGIEYTPKSWLKRAVAAEFHPSGDGFGVSRVFLHYQEADQSIQRQTLWHDLRRPQHAQRIDLGPDPQHLTVSPAGDWLAAAGNDGSLQVFENAPASVSPRCLCKPSIGSVYALVGSPDGKFLAVAKNESLILWRVADGRRVQTWKHDGGRCLRLTFSQDSRYVLSIDVNGRLRRWDVTSGMPFAEQSINREFLHEAAFSPAADLVGCHFAFGDDLGVYDLTSGKTLWRRPHRSSSKLVFSRDGGWVATSWRHTESHRTIRVWHARTGAMIAELPGHNSRLIGLAFGADGTLYSWDANGLFLGRNVRTGRETWRFSALQWASQTELDATTKLQRYWLHRRVADRSFAG